MGDPVSKRVEQLEKAYKIAVDAGHDPLKALRMAGHELLLADAPKASDSPIKDGWSAFKKEVKKWRNIAGWAVMSGGAGWFGNDLWHGRDVTRMPAFNIVLVGVAVVSLWLASRVKT